MRFILTDDFRQVRISKAILFDLDDTLLVEWNSARQTFIETISGLEPALDKEEFVSAIREEARRLWYSLPTIEYCRRVGISSWEALWADFDGEDDHLKLLADLAPEYRLNSWANALLKFGINDSVIAEELSNKFKSIRSTKHILYPDTLECLEYCKSGHKLGLVTNGPPDIQWKKIIGSKLKPYFHAIVISGEYGFAKPDRRLFFKLLDLLNCKAENALMVGDKLKTDILGAKEAGIKSVWLNRNLDEPDDRSLKPDYEISDLSQLYEILTQVFQ